LDAAVQQAAERDVFSACPRSLISAKLNEIAGNSTVDDASRGKLADGLAGQRRFLTPSGTKLR
jgi:hypothetical protein